MNLNTMERILENVKGASFVGLSTETNVSLKGGKKNPLQGKVTKKNTGANIMVFQNKFVNGYEEMVRRRLQKEGKDPDNFTLGKLPWGTRIEGTPFIEHKGDHYLQAVFLRSGKSEYFVDGVLTDPKEIEGLELDKSVPVTEDVEGKEKAIAQGGLENQVIIRTINLKNITKVVVDGKDFE